MKLTKKNFNRVWCKTRQRISDKIRIQVRIQIEGNIKNETN